VQGHLSTCEIGELGGKPLRHGAGPTGRCGNLSGMTTINAYRGFSFPAEIIHISDY
jgi:hypothetical protein